MTDIESAPGLPPPRVWGPWATIAWTTLIVVLMVATQVLVVIVFMAVTATGKESAERIGQLARSLQNDGLFLSVATFSTTLICSAVIIGIVKLRRGSKLKNYLGLIRPNGRQLFGWAVVTMGVCVTFDLISVSLKRPVLPEF